MSCVTRFILTDAQRANFKRPLGELVTGTPEECNGALKDTIAREKPKLVVLVGDTVSRNSVQFGIMPDVIVIDNKEKRREAVQFTYSGRHSFKATNPAGTIDTNAWKIVDEAVRKGNSLVLVEGEEDLLALAAIMFSPTGSLIVYGQPDQGIVLVRVSEEKKREIEQVMAEMERED